MGSRVVVTGKGGVGKTTIVSCLSTLLTRRGSRVLAVDADPQMNLARTLGLDAAAARGLVPLADNAAYVEEKTGVRPGPTSMGRLFKLNPDVDDVVERFGVRTGDGVGLLVMGTVRQAGGGCLCAENVLLDSVIGRLGLPRGEFVLLDTQAGVEHFGRGLARGFSACLVVSDDSLNALTVAARSAALARQSGILTVHLLVSRARSDVSQRLARAAEEAGASSVESFGSVVVLPDEPRLRDLDPEAARILDVPDSAYAQAIARVADLVAPRDCGCTARRQAHEPASLHAHHHDHGHDRAHPHEHGHHHHPHEHGPAAAAAATPQEERS